MQLAFTVDRPKLRTVRTGSACCREETLHLTHTLTELALGPTNVTASADTCRLVCIEATLVRLNSLTEDFASSDSCWYAHASSLSRFIVVPDSKRGRLQFQ